MTAESTYCFGPFHFEASAGRLSRDGRVLPLRAKTSAVLLYLLQHHGRLVPKEELFAAIWPGLAVSEAVLAVCISELRQTLEDERRDARLVETAHGKGYRFIAPVTIRSESILPASARGSEPPAMVGRESELASLRHNWELARSRSSRFVLISGEAGVGKSALAARFLAYLQEFDAPLVGCGQCVERSGNAAVYVPILELLDQLCSGKHAREVREILRRRAPRWLVEIPGILAEAEADALRFQVGQLSAPAMFNQLAEALEWVGTLGPLVLLVEDLHFSDESTQAVLGHLAQTLHGARLLLVATLRTEHAGQNSDQVRKLVARMGACEGFEEIPLRGLAEAEMAEYLRLRLSASLLPKLVTELHRLTRGNPLFVSAMVDQMVRERSAGSNNSGLDKHQPQVLSQYIERQIGRLAPEHRLLLETASVIGNSFSAAALAAGMEIGADGGGEERALELCEQCVEAEGFIRSDGVLQWPDGTFSPAYRLRHDLYRETLYRQIPPLRRQRIHLCVARRLETGFAGHAGRIAGELAMHFERAGEPQRAATYLRLCAETALRLSDAKAAVAHAERGLGLLEPTNPKARPLRARLELIRATALMSSVGFAEPEVVRGFQRARALLPDLKRPAEQMQVLLGLAKYYLVRRHLTEASMMVRRCLRAAERTGDMSALVASEMTLGAVLYCDARYLETLAHMEQAIRLFEPRRDRAHALLYGLDSLVAAKAYAALCLWRLGYPDQAVRASLEAQSIAHQTGHAHSIAMAMTAAATVYADCGDALHLRIQADRLLAFCAARGLQFWHGWGRFFYGRALALQGRADGAVTHLREGIAELAATGADIELPRCLAIPTEVAVGALTPRQGAQAILTSLATMGRGKHLTDVSEMYRIAGWLEYEAVRGEPDCGQPTRAEQLLCQALRHARRHKAKSLELRAAIDLAGIWSEEGNTKAARRLLHPLYGWFKEGFDTRDLKAAKALADALGGGGRCAPEFAGSDGG